MATECHTQLGFSFQPKIVLDFDGGEITTDTGLLLLREFDQQLGLTRPLKGLYNDWRNPFFDRARDARDAVPENLSN